MLRQLQRICEHQHTGNRLRVDERLVVQHPLPGDRHDLSHPSAGEAGVGAGERWREGVAERDAPFRSGVLERIGEWSAGAQHEFCRQRTGIVGGEEGRQATFSESPRSRTSASEAIRQGDCATDDLRSPKAMMRAWRIRSVTVRPRCCSDTMRATCAP